MSKNFVEKDLLVANSGGSILTKVCIGRPKLAMDGLFLCEVSFGSFKKYNANIKGVDQFHALICAISYVNRIFEISSDPEFLELDGESLYSGERDE